MPLLTKDVSNLLAVYLQKKGPKASFGKPSAGKKEKSVLKDLTMGKKTS